jgi:hypothetical protein
VKAQLVHCSHAGGGELSLLLQVVQHPSGRQKNFNTRGGLPTLSMSNADDITKTDILLSL